MAHLEQDLEGLRVRIAVEVLKLLDDYESLTDDDGFKEVDAVKDRGVDAIMRLVQAEVAAAERRGFAAGEEYATKIIDDNIEAWKAETQQPLTEGGNK